MTKAISVHSRRVDAVFALILLTSVFAWESVAHARSEIAGHATRAARAINSALPPANCTFKENAFATEVPIDSIQRTIAKACDERGPLLNLEAVKELNSDRKVSSVPKAETPAQEQRERANQLLRTFKTVNDLVQGPDYRGGAAERARLARRFEAVWGSSNLAADTVNLGNYAKGAVRNSGWMGNVHNDYVESEHYRAFRKELEAASRGVKDSAQRKYAKMVAEDDELRAIEGIEFPTPEERSRKEELSKSVSEAHTALRPMLPILDLLALEKAIVENNSLMSLYTPAIYMLDDYKEAPKEVKDLIAKLKGMLTPQSRKLLGMSQDLHDGLSELQSALTNFQRGGTARKNEPLVRELLTPGTHTAGLVFVVTYKKNYSGKLVKNRIYSFRGEPRVGKAGVPVSHIVEGKDEDATKELAKAEAGKWISIDDENRAANLYCEKP